MSYTPPAGDAITLTFEGAAVYAPPSGDAIAITWEPSAPQALSAAPSPLGAPAALALHLRVALGAAPSPLGAPAALAEYALPFVPASAAAPSPLGAPSIHARRVDVARSLVASPLGQVALYARRVDQARSAVPSPIGQPAPQATVVRFEVRGEVRNQGVLVDRRVRAYRRNDGALIAEQDTTAGRFRLHCGFAAAEHYLVPVDLSAEATDYAPPCANRVLSVLADDLA